jgi:hypothetical protein
MLFVLAVVFGGALLTHASASHLSMRTSMSLRFINLKSCLKKVFLCLAFFLVATPLFAVQAPTTTTLAIGPSNYVAADTVVTLTATVTNPGSVTSGTVNFCNVESTDCSPGSGLYASAQLTSAGTAVIHRVFGYGNNNIKAVFLPTTLSAGSTSLTNTVTVTASPIYASVTTLGETGSAGNYTLSGTVTAFGSQSLTGAIDFLDTTNGNAQIGTASLDLAESTFAGKTDYATESYPESVAVGDFNGDGNLDLAVTNVGSNMVSVLLGKGDGTFQPQVAYAVGSIPNSVAAGDFNGDGKLDLVIANEYASAVSVLLGRGDGTFQPQVTYAVGSYPYAVAVGDFNGDGKLDLVTANENAGTISVLLGRGDGTFQPQVTYAVGANPEFVAVGDFNGDGKLDLAVANVGGNTVSVLLGNGDGTFQPQVVYATGSYPLSVAVGDFNGDGKLDLVTANEYASTVSVLLGNGDGTFRPQVAYFTGLYPDSVAVGDFNGDGKLDLATANSLDSTVSVLFGNGDGTFQPQVAYSTVSNPYAVAVGDFNGDGKLDLVATRESASTASILLGEQMASYSESGIAAYGSGTHSVLASYGGDGSRMSSQSSTVALTAIKATPSVTVFCSPNPIPYGSQTSTCTATVNGGATGTIGFYYNGNNWTNSTLSGGSASASGFNTLPSGFYSIVANYSGDASNNSASGSTTLIIDKTMPMLTWATPAAIPYGTALSGTQLDATSGGVAGTFVYTPASGAALTAGSQTLSVTFNPTDTMDYNSQTAAVTLVVNKATPVLALTSSANPAVYGNTVTFTAQYGTAATGTVTFYDGATVLGTSPLTGGLATDAATSLKGGSHNITVQYAGDANYTAAVSSVLDEVISTSAVTPTITSTINPSTFGVSVTFTFSYAGVTGFAVPTGSVAVTDGGNPLAALTLDATGKAMYTTFSLAVGTHPIAAVYGGDSNYQ